MAETAFAIFLGILVCLVIYWIFAGQRKHRMMLDPEYKKYMESKYKEMKDGKR